MFRDVIKFNAFQKFGITNKDPQAIAVIEELPRPNHFLRLFFQIEGFLKSGPVTETLKKFVDVSQSEIYDFLNGKPFLVEDCSFKVESYRDVFPSESIARQTARKMIQNQSPYIEILDFFDDCDSPDFISAEIKEESCRIRNYKIDIDATSRQKVSFEIHFDLIIQLRNRIQSVHPEFFLTPAPIPSNIKFYSFLKSVLEHPGELYITDKDCLKMKNRCIKDSENAFMHDFKEYFKRGSFVDYFKILQKEICNPKFDTGFFSQLESLGFIHEKERLIYRKSLKSTDEFFMRVDIPLTMNSPLLKDRLEELIDGLESGIQKVSTGLLKRRNFSSVSRNLQIRYFACGIMTNSCENTDSEFLEKKNEFVSRMKMLKDGLQSALQYLKLEVWEKREITPVDHLGEKILTTMRLDPIIHSESDIPVLKNYACQIISGNLLEV